MRIIQQADLQPLHTLRLRAQASVLAYFTQPAQFGRLLELRRQYEHMHVLAGGSNVVFKEQVDALVIAIRTRGIRHVKDEANSTVIEVEAGETWHDFVRFSLSQGWYGLENLALIPGTVGAAPVQNIGAYGVEVERFIRWVEVWDWQLGKSYKLSASECGFAYRDSIFKSHEPGRWLILRVGFAFPKRWQPILDYPDLQQRPGLLQQPTPMAIFDAVCQIRRAKLPDPALLPNAGSFFKNPIVHAKQATQLQSRWPQLRAFALEGGQVKLPAGWLLEQAGWKGKRLGPLGMHKNQALVLVNHDVSQATYHDVQRITAQIQKDMAALFALQLEQEPVTIE